MKRFQLVGTDETFEELADAAQAAEFLCAKSKTTKRVVALVKDEHNLFEEQEIVYTANYTDD